MGRVHFILLSANGALLGGATSAARSPVRHHWSALHSRQGVCETCVACGRRCTATWGGPRAASSTAWRTASLASGSRATGRPQAAAVAPGRHCTTRLALPGGFGLFRPEWLQSMSPSVLQGEGFSSSLVHRSMCEMVLSALVRCVTTPSDTILPIPTSWLVGPCGPRLQVAELRS